MAVSLALRSGLAQREPRGPRFGRGTLGRFGATSCRAWRSRALASRVLVLSAVLRGGGSRDNIAVQHERKVWLLSRVLQSCYWIPGHDSIPEGI